MADMTLSLDELDRFNTCLLKARAIAHVAGATDFSRTVDDCIGQSMWAVTDFLDEANSIINKAHEGSRKAQGTSAPTPSNDLHRLQAAVTDMDALAQQGFSEILAIAKLALAAMETPDGYRQPETIAQALRAICGKAAAIENDINCQAEEVGCNYRNPNTSRRYAAHRSVVQPQDATA
jgi:hypothetical protein